MNKSIVIIMLISILCIFSACEKSDYENLSELSSSPATEEAAKLPNEKIGVYVCGEVMSPGIYYFEANSRIKDAIEAAGGVTVKASLDSMNLAEYLNDCDKIYIPAIGETTESNLSAEEADDRIDINKASLDELMTLPGIGQSKAQSIIDYREEHGAYTGIEEIKNISGIKAGVFEKIKDLIKV